MLDIEDSDQLNYAYYEQVSEKALKEPDFFNVKRLVKVQEMFDARVYMGHKEGTLNNYMKPYIFGSRLGHLVIDLDQSVHLLQEAVNFAAHIAFRNGIILFVNKSASVRLFAKGSQLEFNPKLAFIIMITRRVTLLKRRRKTAGSTATAGSGESAHSPTRSTSSGQSHDCPTC